MMDGKVRQKSVPHLTLDCPDKEAQQMIVGLAQEHTRKFLDFRGCKGQSRDEIDPLDFTQSREGHH